VTADDVSRVTRRLDRQYLAASYDAFLELIGSLGAEGTLPFAVGMLVDGTVVRGVVQSTHVFADHLDAALAELLSHRVPADDSATRDAVHEMFRDLAHRTDDRRKAAREVAEQYVGPEFSLDDIPEADVRSVLDALRPNAFVVVANAQIVVPPSFHRVGAMRVRVDRISAWWPLSSEQDVRINYGDAPSG